ncbi:MAG TPA: hypothetical protein VJC04_03725 [Candidatus Paceibacterota bacterium]
MKIVKRNYRVMSEKGSYSLEMWFLEVPLKEKILIKLIQKPESDKLLEINN